MKTKTNNPSESRPARTWATTLAVAFFGISAVVLLLASSLQIALNVQAQQGCAFQQAAIDRVRMQPKPLDAFIQDKIQQFATAVELSNPINLTPMLEKHAG